ncbi:E3 ubiquitin/ISG15 ligase TRIM25-like isoform X2 [Protopterus annectens]|uniref:E3 ubiquitin/ISG15 ligase TRIM25-like isoform X2 n=1 Tax=Protopterus annectens TaxID=7888 RepID=UPI001CF9E83E|nr:E3 ubiquitin/ISG15 ligase TRIM25-like isoform X2 [Protopterus annectens]
MASERSSMLELSEELTCPICLSIFQQPVTTPCGHNFCQSCLDLTWRTNEELFGGYSCPQCRKLFVARPVLHKNTVLCSVVEHFQDSTAEDSSSVDESCLLPEDVPCDTCMRYKATKTCLTCMASYCEQHLKPHLESPAFQGHLLNEPLKDLQDRLCQDHSKLLELFCRTHSKCICYVCLMDHSKACKVCQLDEGKQDREAMVKEKLSVLYKEISKADEGLEEMKKQEKSCSEAAAQKRALLENEFSLMKSILEKEEKDAIKSVDQEEKKMKGDIGYSSKVIAYKKEEYTKLKDQMELCLQKSDNIAFLKAVSELPSSGIKNIFVPKHDIDHKKLQYSCDNATALKDVLKMAVTQQLEQRLQLSRKTDKKSDDHTAEVPDIETGKKPSKGKTGPGPDKKSDEPDQEFKKKPPKGKKGPASGKSADRRHFSGPQSSTEDRGEYVPDMGNMPAPPQPQPSYGPSDRPRTPGMGNVPPQSQPQRVPSDRSRMAGMGKVQPPKPYPGNLPSGGPTTSSLMTPPSGCPPEFNPFFGGFVYKGPDSSNPPTFGMFVPPCPKEKEAAQPTVSPSFKNMETVTRQELLLYACRLTADLTTAHKRVTLAEKFKKISVSEVPHNYPDNAGRFSSCAQVLCTQSFSSGCHYWEVTLSNPNSYCGIGVSYRSIERTGPRSRLGRNNMSWCIEWFSVKLCAWHNDIETVLSNPNPSKVGVFLNYGEGKICFFAVKETVKLVHEYQACFTEPVHPAFWVFSSGTTLSLV